MVKTAIENPFLAFNFNDAEENIYKKIIGLSKIPRPDTRSVLNKIKVTDLVANSKYSKPKVYNVIKRLKAKGLIEIDNSRPLFIRPLDPESAIKKLVDEKKKTLDKAGTLLVEEIKSLQKLDINYPFSKTPPLNFFNGEKEYFKVLNNSLSQAKKEILLICGYLVGIEVDLIRDIIGEKLKQGLEIRVLYGGSTKKVEPLNKYFNERIIAPNRDMIKKFGNKISIDSAIYLPALRITIVDNSDMCMALKQYEEEDLRLNITEVSGIRSDDKDFIRSTRDTFIILKELIEKRLVQRRLQK